MSPADRQAAFVARLRKALGRKGALTATPTPPVVSPELVRRVADDADLVTLFESRALEVGMVVDRVPAAAWIDDVVADLVRRGTRTCMLAIERTGLETELTEALGRAGIDVRSWRRAPLDGHFDVDAGITDVHAALADSGSLVVCSDAAHGRAMSLIPPLHVAIVRRRDILGGLFDWTATLADTPAGALPSCQVLITGPSKTSDIEGILVTGVHGPKTVRVVLVSDDQMP